MPLFKLSVCCEKGVAARYYSVFRKQLQFANDRNRVCGAVLGLSQDGACTNQLENFSKNSLKGDLSNDTTENPPLFSMVNTFNALSFIPTPSYGVKNKEYPVQNEKYPHLHS